MTEHKALTGACLCGAVTITVTPSGGIGACHCGMCRKWGGGPLMAVGCGAKIGIGGEGKVRTYRSSDWAERAFCGTCGSNLYYRLLPGQFSPESEYIVSAGLFDDPGGLDFDHEVFVDSNPGWYRFAGEENRRRMTEADIMAMVDAQQNESSDG